MKIRTPRFARPCLDVERLEDRVTPSHFSGHEGGPPFGNPGGGGPPFDVPPGKQFAVGADQGANGHVKVFNANGILRYSFIAFPGFNGGVRVATGDVNGDGVDDIAVGAGFGAGNGHIKVFDGATGELTASFFSFQGFLGGVDVAIGDVNGDGNGDLIVGSGPSASHVKVFDFATGDELASFIAYDGSVGGVTVTTGDLDGDGIDEVITGSAGGGAHVKAFSVAGGTATEILSFLPYEDIGYAGGIDVAAADLRGGDGLAEIAVSPLDRGSGEEVRVFDAAGTLLGSFTPNVPRRRPRRAAGHRRRGRRRRRRHHRRRRAGPRGEGQGVRPRDVHRDHGLRRVPRLRRRRVRRLT
jgi:hypothetical protein